MDRKAAEVYVSRHKLPVLRPSSIAGHYALTVYKDRVPMHFLICISAAGTIDIVSEQGLCMARFKNSSELLAFGSLLSGEENPSINP